MPTAVDTMHPARGQHRAPETVTRARIAYLDNLKALLVALIIAAHGIVGYSGFEGSWPYQPNREVALAEVSDAILGTLILPPVLFAMGLFFLIGGLVTPGPVTRKGPRRFARDRLVRLGIPLVIVVLGVWPAMVYLGNRMAGQEGSYWQHFMNAEPFLDAGPMWFVEVLLIFSLGYAAWRRWSGTRPPREPPQLGRTLVLLAAGVSAATILIRPVFPFDSHQVGELQLWQWPQYLAMFGLGILAARHGWFEPVPAAIRRRCGAAALAGLAAFLVLMGAVIAAGFEPEDAFGDLRLHWAPISLALIEGPLAVCTSVWLLAAAQRHLDGPPGRWGRAAGRSAFAAFVLQGPVLIGLALALRGVDAPAEIKALTVACAGVAASFFLAWLLVTRTRVGRVL